jgi:hypothetical protein
MEEILDLERASKFPAILILKLVFQLAMRKTTVSPLAA